jgi:hypothetical protein
MQILTCESKLSAVPSKTARSILPYVIDKLENSWTDFHDMMLPQITRLEVITTATVTSPIFLFVKPRNSI